LPLYEYRCLKCKRHIEKIEKLSGPNLKKCPHCGGKVESVITAPAIQFKGTGWYITDYGRKTPGGDGSKSEQTEKSEKTEKSLKSDSKPAAPAKKEDKKSATPSKEK
jgi:putative FmdB family regulatory protein